jgi:transcriptional regulator of acetoin/glycerol metabolism
MMLTDSAIIRREQLQPRFRVEPAEDWRALLRTRAHMLVTGSRTALAAFARAARSELREPVASVAATTPLFLEGARTLILNDVNLLDHAGQHRLLAWLNESRNADTQVLSLTSARVFEFVTKGFDANLYYRLNTIYIELQDT